MKKHLGFFLPLDNIPKGTAQQKGYNHYTRKYYQKRTVSDAEKVYALYLKTMRPEEPMTGAIELDLIFYFPANKPHKNGQAKVTRSDVDNLAKLPIDIMTRLGYWNDDSQIFDLRIAKFYADQPGLEVVISEYDTKQLFDDKGRMIL